MELAASAFRDDFFWGYKLCKILRSPQHSPHEDSSYLPCILLLKYSISSTKGSGTGWSCIFLAPEGSTHWGPSLASSYAGHCKARSQIMNPHMYPEQLYQEAALLKLHRIMTNNIVYSWK